MPELPEVETVRVGLARLLPGKTVKEVQLFDSPRSFPNSQVDIEQFLDGFEVRDVRRRAKVLMIDLSSEYSLVIHLKMTGQLVYRGGEDFGGGHPTGSLIGELPDRSTRVRIGFVDGSNLYFNDQRKFGWVKLLPTVEIQNLAFFQKVGPEPLETSTTPEMFIQRIRRRNGSMVKAALLDQAVLAGLGNIYVDETLWGAKIHPETRVEYLSDTDLKLLFSEAVKALKLSLEHGGSSRKDYVDAEGRPGYYLDFASAYGREGQPCRRHPDVLIEKIKVAGRGTHICPVCQRKLAS